jgi:hypothetical protein
MATDPIPAIPSWLVENASRVWGTGVLLSIQIVVGPSVSGPSGGKMEPGWYASLEVPPFEDAVWQCDHLHGTTEEAYQCAVDELARRMEA